MYTIAILPQGKASSHLSTSSRGCLGNPSSNHPAQGMLLSVKLTSLKPNCKGFMILCQLDPLCYFCRMPQLPWIVIIICVDLDFELPNSFVPTNNTCAEVSQYVINQGGKEHFPCLKGNMSSNGPFSIVMFMYWSASIPRRKSMSLHVAPLSNIAGLVYVMYACKQVW